MDQDPFMLAAAPRPGPRPIKPPPPPPAVETPSGDGVTRGPETEIDQLSLWRLKQQRLEPAPLCSDAVFLRRAFLDVIGTLPTAGEARAFLLERDTAKRRNLIDHLLERPEFADYWAVKWGDLLRVKAEFPINLWPNAAQAYDHWIRAGLRQNKPYDQFVRELLTSSGSNFRVPAVNFYRAVQSRDPQALAQAAALVFLGQRAETWPAGRLAGLAAFFAQVGYKSTQEWKEEIVFWDASRPIKGPAVFPDGVAAALPADQDPRLVLADWLIGVKGAWLARAIVNRIWCWLLGRGLIHEADDLRPDNPPSLPEVLAYLEQQLVGRRFDLKHIYRLILNSHTYQRASTAPAAETRAAAEASFACYAVRRLEAEVIADALCQITGTTEVYTSPIPEPFTFIPKEQRSIQLPDGSITSPFLELFGRPARDTGLESERNNRATAAQRLHLLNSTHVRKKIESARPFAPLLNPRRSLGEMLAEVYLAILSRPPAPAEIRTVTAYAANHPRREVLMDLVWALINSTEFLYRH